MLGIGAIIGAGIFATIGTAAAGDATRPGAGPALMLSFVLTGVACGFAALCYAEFAAMVPISGSAYTYAYATLGELVAWIIGWDLIIEYAVGNVAVAISWANYFKTLVVGLRHHHPRLAVDRLPDRRAHSRPLRQRARICSASRSSSNPGVRHRRADHGRAGHRHPRERHAQHRRWSC